MKRGWVPRATRYPLEMRLQYRPLGQTRWWDGHTRNISRTGLLFEGEQLVKANALVEMLVRLPTRGSGRAGAAIHCRGEVVRALGAADQVAPALAAKLIDYDLLPVGGRLPR